MLYVSRDSSFTNSYTIILILDHQYFYVFFSGDIHLSLGISLSCSFVTVSELFSNKLLENFVILLVILLPIQSTLDSAVFWINFFEVVLTASVADCLAWSRNF